MCVIFQDRCWVVHIPFVPMVKFKLLAHLPVDHLAYPDVSRIILMVSTGLLVTASLFKSPALFSVFWPILIMLQFGWSPLVPLFPSPPVPVPIFWWLYRVHQLQLVSVPLSCSIVFFSVLWQGLGTDLSFHFLSV